MKKRCQITVYRRDTYRHTGRTGSGFEMHHEKGQCKRAAIDERDCCAQHARMIDAGWNLGRAKYYEYIGE